MVRIRAFVFDDDRDTREVLRIVLEDRGYEVLAYRHPSMCPIFLDTKCPCPRDHACGDILLTDMNMPFVSGLEFIENQTRNGCKGIVQNKAVMSGAWTDELRARAKALGCRTFTKPISFGKLDLWLDERERMIDPNRKLTDLKEMFEGDGASEAPV